MRQLNVKQVLKRHGLRPKRSWSQNFLVDLDVLQQIVESSEIQSNDIVVELGAGLGALTTLLLNRCQQVIAVERDRDLAAVLRSEFAGDERVTIKEADAAKLDWTEIAASVERAPIVVGNLPYHIASRILFNLIEAGPLVKKWIVMVQREMAQRMVAEPGGRDYGVLTLNLQLLADVVPLLTVPPDAFVPEPRVYSQVVRGITLVKPRVQVDDIRVFKRLVKGVFSQRRKTLRNGLKHTLRQWTPDQIDALLSHANVDGNVRAECLDISSFAAMANYVNRNEFDEQGIDAV